jgi:choline-sulfatase
MTKTPPNILIVMADQLAAQFLPAYGHGIVKTPAIDRLARDGVAFENAYCASPLCSPSRASFMTGLLPSRTNVFDNAAEFVAGLPTYAHHLRRLGYRTVLSGKMHFCGPDQMHGFEARLTTDIYPADFGWTPDWDRPDERPSWYHNMSSVTRAGLCVRTNQLDFDDEVAFTSEREIYNKARGLDQRPLLLVASFTHPHDPYAITREYYDLYRDEEIDLPAAGVRANDPHSRRLRHVCAMDAEPATEAEIRHARRAYYGEISYFDHNVGRLLKALDDCGLYDDTIVIVVSDHGDMLGERGLWYKMSFFEAASRVPLIVSAPKRFAPRRVAGSVSLVDVAPTLIDLAGGVASELAEHFDGRSLLGHLVGSGGHDEAIGEYLAEGAIAPIVMLRRGSEKFIHSPADPDQLYDLASDPGELTNLADSADSAARVAYYRQEIGRRWDLAALEARVRASQRRRRLVDDALNKGEPRAWDFQPFNDAARQYVRNTIPLDDLEAMARFPRVSP